MSDPKTTREKVEEFVGDHFPDSRGQEKVDAVDAILAIVEEEKDSGRIACENRMKNHKTLVVERIKEAVEGLTIRGKTSLRGKVLTENIDKSEVLKAID